MFILFSNRTLLVFFDQTFFPLISQGDQIAFFLRVAIPILNNLFLNFIFQSKTGIKLHIKIL